MQNVPKAFVLGDLDLVRAIGESGVPVVLFANVDDDPAARSRYVKRAHRLPDPDQDPDAAIALILQAAAEEPVPPVIFPQGDADLLLVSRRRAELAPHARLLLPEHGLVEDAVDKLRFCKLAARRDLPVPKTCILPPFGDRGDVASWDRFPAIVKPALRSGWFGSSLAKRAGGARKALRIEDRRALDDLLPALYAHDLPLLLQESVEGGEENVVSYHAYARAGGEVVGEFTGRKVRTWSRTHGISTCVEITDDPQVRDLGRDVLAKLSFSGVVKLDFKRCPRTGRLFLLEMNPRFNLWHWPGAVAGVNLPRLVYDDLLVPGSAKAGRARPGVRFVALREDLRAFREYRAAGDLDGPSWLRSVATAEACRELRASDPLPGLFALTSSLGRAAGKLWGRLAASTDTEGSK